MNERVLRKERNIWWFRRLESWPHARCKYWRIHPKYKVQLIGLAIGLELVFRTEGKMMQQTMNRAAHFKLGNKMGRDRACTPKKGRNGAGGNEERTVPETGDWAFLDVKKIQEYGGRAFSNGFVEAPARSGVRHRQRSDRQSTWGDAWIISSDVGVEEMRLDIARTWQGNNTRLLVYRSGHVNENNFGIG